MNGPFGIKVEMWGLAKDWGLNLDELDPDRDRLYGRDFGDSSAKTRLEKDMLETGVTVEDLKEVDRGEHGNPADNFKDVIHPPLDPSLYVCAFGPMPEDFDPEKIIESLGDLDDDDDEDYDLCPDLPPISNQGSSANDGDIIKKDEQMDDGEIKKDVDNDDVLFGPPYKRSKTDGLP